MKERYGSTLPILTTDKGLIGYPLFSSLNYKLLLLAVHLVKPLKATDIINGRFFHCSSHSGFVCCGTVLDVHKVVRFSESYHFCNNGCMPK